MLQNIREKTSGWIAYVVIGLISIPFVLAGITSYFGGGQLAPAAVVDGNEISSQQLDFAYRNYLQRLRSLFGGEIPESFNNEAVLKEQVRDQLIEEQVLLAYVNDEKFRLGDQALNKKITNMKVFQEDGKFNADLYQGQLRSQGIVPQQFEEDLRRSEEMAQVRKAINTTSITSNTRNKEQAQLQSQQRSVKSLVLPIDKDSIVVTDTDLEKEYQTNANRYMTPERVKIDYIELNIETIKAGIHVSEQEVRDYYNQVKDDLVATEVRETSHILLMLNEDDSDQIVEDKKALALSLIEKIKSGESFSALAKEHSQDPGSASDGGDLGDVEKGMMVAPFEAALFKLNIGEISEPIRTKFGWHIIKLMAKSGGEVPSFDSKRVELTEQLKTETADTKIYDLSESLSNLTYEQPDSIIPAAEQLGLKIQTSDWFGRHSGAGIASNLKVRDLAFTSSVLKEDRNSETLELGDNHILVMHLNEHQEAALPPLSEIKGQLIGSLKIQKARLFTAEKGKAGLKIAKTDGLAAVANDWNQVIKDDGLIKRDSTVDQRDIINLAFKMAKPNGASTFQGIELANGDYAIIEVSDVVIDDLLMKPDNSKKAGVGTYEYQAWLSDIVSTVDVVKTPLSELQ